MSGMGDPNISCPPTGGPLLTAIDSAALPKRTDPSLPTLLNDDVRHGGSCSPQFQFFNSGQTSLNVGPFGPRQR
jgi:hypothetical protein